MNYDNTDISQIISSEVQDFLRMHEDSDVNDLILSGRTVGGVPARLLAEQILSRRKAMQKLPDWYKAENIVFPPPLSLEQASSEETGHYKSGLFQGKEAIDITGGMGIDTTFFANNYECVTYVEKNKRLVAVFAHNRKALGFENISLIHGDGTDYLRQARDHQYDLLYADPARRDPSAKKVFAISDCEPDIAGIQGLMRKKARVVMIKLSPMLDISHSLDLLDPVSEVHVVAVNNECKELLFIMKESGSDQTLIHTVNIHKSGIERFEFTQKDEAEAAITIGLPTKYLYEPNVAVLKAGAFRVLCERYQLVKADHNTHLYSSDDIIPEFPGKIYRIEAIYASQKKEVVRRIGHKKVSVKVRNYPLSVAEIRKKYSLKDGNDAYVFFCHSGGKKLVLECVRV